MPVKPPEPPRPHTPISPSLLKFLPAGMPRDAAEIIVAGLPGAFVLALFIAGTGLLNVYFNLSGPNPWFAATYVPVVCLLPLVVGLVAPLVLERVRGVDVLSLRRSVLAATLSGLVGSLIGAFGIIITGAIPNSKPFGAALTGIPVVLALAIALVFICTVLSAIGGALLVLFLNRAMMPKSEG